MATLESRELKRINFAYEEVKAFVESTQDKNKLSKYKSRVKDFPSLIKTNGLAPAVAFYNAKGEKDDSYKEVLGHLKEWLAKQFDLLRVSSEGYNEFVTKLTGLSVYDYMLVTEEAVKFLMWLSRAAEAYIEDAKDSEK